MADSLTIVASSGGTPLTFPVQPGVEEEPLSMAFKKQMMDGTGTATQMGAVDETYRWTVKSDLLTDAEADAIVALLNDPLDPVDIDGTIITGGPITCQGVLNSRDYGPIDGICYLEVTFTEFTPT